MKTWTSVNRYFARYADTTAPSSADVMLSTLDSLLSLSTLKCPVERWGGSMEEWQQNIETLKDLISRHVNSSIPGIAECYKPQVLTRWCFRRNRKVAPSSSTPSTHTTLPWTGEYFDMTQSPVATPNAGYTFRRLADHQTAKPLCRPAASTSVHYPHQTPGLLCSEILPAPRPRRSCSYILSPTLPVAWSPLQMATTPMAQSLQNNKRGWQTSFESGQLWPN